MNFDYERLSQMENQIDQVLSTLPYPIDKEELVLRTQQAGANPEVVGAMRQILPDAIFNSSQDIKKFFSSRQGQPWV